MTRILRHWARAARAALLLAFAVASPGMAQVRPVGVLSMSPEAIQDRLGPCPVEELRAAWSDMEAVERAAVEQEVIRLCTERAVLVGELLAAHRDLRAALGELVPALPAPVAVPASVEPAESLDVEGPEAETANLKPDPAATGDIPPDIPGPARAAAFSDPPGPGDEPVGQPADSVGLDDLADPPALSREAGGDPSQRTLPPPGAVLPGDETDQVAVLDEAAVPAEPAGPSWMVLFTARRSDGEWLAMIRETGPARIVLPALSTATEGDAAAPPVLAPRPAESALVSEGDPVPADGPVVVRIDGSGVEVAPGADGETAMLRWAPAGALPWAPAGPTLEPGRPDFLYEKEGE